MSIPLGGSDLGCQMMVVVEKSAEVEKVNSYTLLPYEVAVEFGLL
jgi:hypothetical protein